MINTFFSGLLYPFKALGLILADRSLWKYVGLPILVNLIIGATLYASLLFAGFNWIDSLVTSLPAWAAFLSIVLRILLVILLFLGTGFVLVRVGVVLGSPWYSHMSYTLEERFGSQPPNEQPEGWGNIIRVALRDIWRALSFELKKLAVFGIPGIILLICNFIPGAGQVISIIGSVLIGVLVSCFDFFDPPLERRLLRFRQKYGFIRQNMPASLGFGLICFLLVSIPLVNLISIPVCIAAGTIFFCDHHTKLTEVAR